ncbi:hypothetical protein OsJ_05548 [Oryza sativa Japonica Group]|uniref:Uncharacterized protein n=1 Tax=Oryza sativa subsp. japonica TaxID=39947 RepID=B9F399_ORYSJ|nr:hypothetical protein OsJ_05548 [Oryza sativa Japonica Group]
MPDIFIGLFGSSPEKVLDTGVVAQAQALELGGLTQATELKKRLNKEGFKADQDIEPKLTTTVLQQLEDTSGEVSGLAVKCLAPLVKKVGEDSVVEMTNILCDKLLNGKDQHRDTASIALKTIIAEVTTTTLAEKILVSLAPQLIKGATAGKSAEVKCECLDILGDVLHRFGNLITKDHDCMLTALLSQLSSNQASVRKKSISCIASLAACLSDDLLAKATFEVVQLLKNRSAKSEIARTNIQMIGALSESANEYTDDEDASWKVRRASAKCLYAIIVSRPEMLSKMYLEACPKLIEWFREREENVKSTEPMLAILLLFSPRWLLKQEVPKVVKSINRQLREKSIKTKDKSSTSNLKIEALVFTRLVMASHSPAVFHPYIQALSGPILSAIGDRYDKVTAEALRVCEELVRVLRPNSEPHSPDYRPYIGPIYKAILARLANQDQDQDQEVKECAISCMSLALSTFGDGLQRELPACLPVLVDRMGNEITRLTAVKILESIDDLTLIRYLIKWIPAQPWADGEIYLYSPDTHSWSSQGMKMKFFIMDEKYNMEAKGIYKKIDELIGCLLKPFKGRFIPPIWMHLIKDVISYMSNIDNLAASLGSIDSYVLETKPERIKVILFPFESREVNWRKDFATFLIEHLRNKWKSTMLDHFINILQKDFKIGYIQHHPLLQDFNQLSNMIRMTWKESKYLTVERRVLLSSTLNAIRNNIPWTSVTTMDAVVNEYISKATNDSLGLFMEIKKIAAHYIENRRKLNKEKGICNRKQVHPIEIIEEIWPGTFNIVPTDLDGLITTMCFVPPSILLYPIAVFIAMLKDLEYSENHEWVSVEGDYATIGISDHAQSEYGYSDTSLHSAQLNRDSRMSLGLEATGAYCGPFSLCK